MAVWTPKDGYFGTLLAALAGNAMRRESGQQNSGGAPGRGSGHVITADTALKLSAVWSCVRINAESIGSMPIKVWTVNHDGSRIPNTEHWIYRLFNAGPNRYQTRNEFFETLMINLMLAGNAYCRFPARARTGRVVSLLSLMATQTEVKLNKQTGDREYIYTQDGVKTRYGNDRIWHVPLMPSNSIVGLSPLQFAARTMGTAVAAEDRVSTLAANGFKTTGVLTVPHLLKPEQREQIRGQFDDLQTGAGDPLKVLEAGMTFQSLSLSPKDVQLLESRRFSIEDICRFFGVPSILVNDTSGSTKWGNGVSEIKDGYYTLTLRPLLEKLESSIEKNLLAPSEFGKIKVEFDFSTFLRGDEKTRTETQASAVVGNLMTINEARAIESRPPVEGGDVMYAQMQMIPIGSEAPSDVE